MREGSAISGLRRYDDEIYRQCSQLVDVERYRSRNNKVKTFISFRQGDVTHITTHQLAFLKTFKHVKNCVVTVHDIIQHLWYNRKRQVQELWIFNEFLLNRADMYIADSKHTKLDLITHFGIDEDKIKPVYLGVDHLVFYPRDKEMCREHFGMKPDEEYLLGVSSGAPWKNTGIFGEIHHNIIDIGYGRGQFGTLAEEELAMLYCACDAYLNPSKAEGFGLPVVEAMACGCPVITSNCTSLPEVVERGGVTVDPDDPMAWDQAIDTVLGSRNHYVKRALDRASYFSWEKCGEETVAVYNQMI